MKTYQLFATTALAATLLGGGLTAASAQSFTVTGPSSVTGPVYTYAYTITPTNMTSNLLTFNFSDPNVIAPLTAGTFVNATPASVTGGIFIFVSPTGLASGSSQVFSFTSTDGPGGTLGSTSSSFVGSTSVAAVASGLAPAPEPGSLVSLSVLAGSLGLVGLARRRRASQN